MFTLRAFVLAAVAGLIASVPAVVAADAPKAKKKAHHHHTYHGVIEKIEHKEHKIVVKLHHARTKTTTTATSAKRGSKKTHKHTEVTLHVGKETKVHVHGSKSHHSFAALKVGEHVVVYASGHEAKDIEVHATTTTTAKAKKK